jgi:tRNA modification GTPase
MTSAETIFALASAPGRAGIAVIRLSGPRAGQAITELGCAIPQPRKAARARLTDPASGDQLDDGLLLWFPAPHSFTGEDVAELHVHGGRAVVESVLDSLSNIAGLRIAEPGEFTRRAFSHDKIDLTQAEALADLVDAETRAQQKQALRQMGGALKEIYEDWRHRIVQALAHLEALIDFPDEDLPPALADKVWRQVDDLREAIVKHLNDGGRGERIREGLMVAIIGPPNAGKSSLLNLLARRDAAIVSSIPGTTRDVIEVHMNLGGYAVTLADTAGLREARDAIEYEGIKRAKCRAADADLKIVVFDGAIYPVSDEATEALIDDDTIVVINKGDLLGRLCLPKNTYLISVKTGEGIENFSAALLDRIAAKSDTGAAIPLTRARHRKALEDCVESLKRPKAANLPELAAEDLRLAARALGRLTGRVDVDEVLDVVFRDFCIGK